MSDVAVAPTQQTYIEVFSKEEISSYYGAMYPFFNKLDRDFHRDLKLGNYIAPSLLGQDEGFEVTIDSEYKYWFNISPGTAVINGTVITIEETTQLRLGSSSHFIYKPSDYIPYAKHRYNLYVVLRYKPTVDDNNAYLGLVYDTSYMEDDLDYIVVLGILQADGAETFILNTIESITAETAPSIPCTYRPTFPYNYFDGGTI
ncbi:MAG: hypothetical protein KAS32_03540 [Candidatus Peribacteraceae bacterium]|nr:hypothetical protein [Candidatus Peribacteraceae bacterium]